MWRFSDVLNRTLSEMPPGPDVMATAIYERAADFSRRGNPKHCSEGLLPVPGRNPSYVIPGTKIDSHVEVSSEISRRAGF